MAGSKRTRDLPNLNVCHGCQYRASNTGKDKLLTLASEWRLVLLCKKCFCRVESAEICSYCFSQASSECFQCSVCSRRIHKDCALRGNGDWPWSCSFSRSDFSVCIDCWLPRLLHSEYRRIGDKSKVVPNSCLAESDSTRTDRGSKVQKKIIDAECRVLKAVYVRAKRKTVEKALPTQNATETTPFTNCVGNGGSSAPVDYDGNRAPVDDGVLTLKGWKCLNMSPIISRTSRLDHRAASEMPKHVNVCQWNLELCKKKNEFNDLNKSVSEPSVSTVASNHHTDRKVGKVFEVKTNIIDVDEYIALKEEEQSCSVKLTFSSGGENSMDLEENSLLK